MISRGRARLGGLTPSALSTPGPERSNGLAVMCISDRLAILETFTKRPDPNVVQEMHPPRSPDSRTRD